MEHNETQKQINLPVIQRLDRLDHMLNYIEAQKNLPVPTEEINNDPCKDLSSVLEEVPLKGSLMERVTSLERRVVKLTQGLEEERSELFKKLTVKGCKCTLEEKLQEAKQATQIEDHDEISMQDKEHEEKEKEMHEFDGKKRQRKSERKINPNSRYRKWVASIPTWC
ncbi:hypothetical protein FCM35_KLT07741 [Carex littledalei]|uniref:Uncharacterized protein n=1 Tax=Carex littledalei TaxID=544730 RepID=A0A833QZH3_9POAL|nr:hypothetical protein FCM35_KLT07741 [Carex littledalei]